MLPLNTFTVVTFASSALADYLTGTYPPPRDLTSDDSLVGASWENLSSTFDSFSVHDQTSKLTQPLKQVDAQKVAFST